MALVFGKVSVKQLFLRLLPQQAYALVLLLADALTQQLCRQLTCCDLARTEDGPAAAQAARGGLRGLDRLWHKPPGAARQRAGTTLPVPCLQAHQHAVRDLHTAMMHLLLSRASTHPGCMLSVAGNEPSRQAQRHSRTCHHKLNTHLLGCRLAYMLAAAGLSCMLSG